MMSQSVGDIGLFVIMKSSLRPLPSLPSRDVEHLKERLLEEWARFDQNIIDSAINEWRVRLRACVQAGVGHFEQTL